MAANAPHGSDGTCFERGGISFLEFDRLHILESQFFTNNDNFESRSRPAADPAVKRAFTAQIEKAKQLSDKALAKDPNDPNALFLLLCLCWACRRRYAALIEKRDFAGLGYLKDGRMMADRLLRVDPNCYDAYIAVGVENYLLSLKPAPVRWLLRLGAQTDKATGLKNLQIASEKGHYLRPYARLLLAVAALRDQDRGKARTLLAGLAQEFPLNHLYVRELNQLQ